MKTVFELSPREIEEAITAYVEKKTGREVVRVSLFPKTERSDEAPATFANVECVPAQDDAQPDEWAEDMLQRSVEKAVMELAEAAGIPAKACQVNRECEDFVTKAELPAGTRALWIEGWGVTKAPLAEWPKALARKLDQARPKKGRGGGKARSKPKSTASAAADVLGGSGGALDRSGGLSGGVGDV